MRDLCLQCLRPKKACFCESITPFETNTDFRILMHPMEAKEKVATGRLANITLRNCRIHVGIKFEEENKLMEDLRGPEFFPVVLYPGEKSWNISETSTHLKQKVEGKKLLVLAIDATWPHAKLMMRENPFLHHLPWISFNPPGVSAFSIKHQPSEYCLSTIESLYYVLEGLKLQEMESDLESQHQELLLTLNKLVEFQKKCAADPTLSHYRNSGGYKSPSQRVKSKKWKSRAICFDENNYHENDFGPLGQ